MTADAYDLSNKAGPQMLQQSAAKLVRCIALDAACPLVQCCQCTLRHAVPVKLSMRAS